MTGLTPAPRVQTTLTPQVQVMKPDVQYRRTANRVVGVASRVSGNQVQILVRTDGLVGNYKEFTVRNPSPKRVVVDLFGLLGQVPQNSYSVNKSHVKRVRLGEHPGYPGYTRVVVDLTSRDVPHYYVTRTKGGILISVAMEYD